MSLTKLEKLEEKVLKAQEALEQEKEALAKSFGEVILENFDQKSFKNKSSFREWYKGVLSQEEDHHEGRETEEAEEVSAYEDLEEPEKIDSYANRFGGQNQYSY